MYAVISTGGKQYKVEEGDRIRVEKIEENKGDEVIFEDVLLVGEEGKEYSLGTPIIEKAKVRAKVLRQLRAKKIIVFKIKRRKGYRKKMGHRQYLTELLITGIETGKEE